MKKPSAKKPAKKAKPAPPKTTARTSASNHDFTELKSLQEIKNLIEFAAEKQFDEIELERGDFRLRLSKGSPVQVAVPVPAPVIAAPVTAHPVVESPAEATPVAPAPVAPEENLHIITSPIVGTFYRSSSPTADPFVKIGDAIESGQTLCIVEAMKLMNEIQSDVKGIIVKILIENGQPVEYGQPLFGIKA